MRARELQAIVVGHTDFRDADRIAHLLTAECGKISALARGARKSGRRFGGSVDVGNRLTVQARPGRSDLWTLQDAHLLRGHPRLREDLERLSLMVYACEFVGSLAQSDRPEPRLFGLLDTALVVLDAAAGPPLPMFRMALESKALTFAGFAPQLQACASCGGELDDPCCYDLSAGGIVHRGCGNGQRVDTAWARDVEHARRTPLADLLDVEAPAGPRWLFCEHLSWQIGRAVKSRALLSSIETTNAAQTQSP